MPFGQYKGAEMENVPAVYLLWLQTELDSQDMKASQEDISAVREYIEDNLDVLHYEIKRDEAKSQEA